MSHKIAIIEDDTALAQMYELKFQSRGYKTAVAHNGVEGLALGEKFKPDMILLDLMMPQMTGAEMLEKLRATGWGSKIRVLILTNVSKDEAPSELKLLNVDRYIVKAHYTPSQVVEIVQEVLGEKPKARKK